MKNIDAGLMDFRELNGCVAECAQEKINIENCLGQRFLGDGLSDKKIRVSGTPGNALGAYLNGAEIELFGNAQDATGDTMNDGRIIIHGSSGDATGYAMRGGKIYVEGNVGYRAGIHMKAYKDKLPVLLIGGCAGSFLGEYQAGGIIIVLGRGAGEEPPVGNFCGTGMHGGKIYLKTSRLPVDLPSQLHAAVATPEDMAQIDGCLSEFADCFCLNKSEIAEGGFYVLTPNSGSPYKQMYVNS